MISPFTGGKATSMHEESTTVFRGEEFSYTRYFYRCEDTGITFTDKDCDKKGLEQIYEKYRNKYCIPSPEMIKNIRQAYNLSAITMSRILGLGDNQYGLYENGEMPSKTIGKLISTIQNKQVFDLYLNMARDQFSEKEYSKIKNRLNPSVGIRSYIDMSQDYSNIWRFKLNFPQGLYYVNEKTRWRKYQDNNSLILA